MSELFSAAKENVQFLIVCIIVTAVIITAAKLAEYFLKLDVKSCGKKTRRIAFIGIFSAVAAVLMYFEIPLPFIAPGFYKLDFSEVPVLICAFAYGPVSGVICEFVKIVLKLFLKGTSTAFVGELANYVVGCSLILPASIIYFFKKTRKTALWGMGVGTLVMTAFGSTFNALYLLPAFMQLYGMPMEALISAGQAISSPLGSLVNSFGTLALFCVAPFNLIKGIIVSALTFILYKKISVLIHKQHEM